MNRLVIVGTAMCILALMVVPVFGDFSDGLVLYLPFDEGEGDIAADISGNGHDGKIDKPEWVDGRFGKALKFLDAESGTFVTVESTAKLNVNEMTFTAWINAEHWNGVRQIAGKSVHGGCGGRTQYGLFSENNAFTLRFEAEAGRVDVIGPLPDTKVWVHVAATNDGKEAKLFLDGEEVAKGPMTGKLNANDDPFRVGQDCERTNYIFAGLIDEVRLWNRALTQDEINAFKDLGASDALSVMPRGKLVDIWGHIKTGR